jgi:uncharacterized membrane protein YqjE
MNLRPLCILLWHIQKDETIRPNMYLQLKLLLSKFGLMHHMIIIVKNEGNNLIALLSTLCSIINGEHLKLFKVHEGNFF